MELSVGESGNKGFVFDVTTNTLNNANDFLLLGLSVDSILKINDVNNDGSFVGLADIGGVQHGFVGSFIPRVPEPSSLLLTTLAAASLFTIRRSHFD